MLEQRWDEAVQRQAFHKCEPASIYSQCFQVWMEGGGLSSTSLTSSNHHYQHPHGYAWLLFYILHQFLKQAPIEKR